jgi:fructokinase
MIVALGEVLWDLLPSGPRAGGAPFNFAFHCHQLGHPAAIVSAVGDDDLGRDLRAEVRRLGLSDEFIQTDPDHPTGTVPVRVDASGVPTFEIVDNVAWDHVQWQPELEGLARSANAVCFGTLAQRRWRTRETIRQFVREASAESLAVCDLNLRPPFVDASIIYDSVRLADWLKVSEGEGDAVVDAFHLTIATGVPHGGPQFWQRLLPTALPPADAVFVVTRGEKGCIVGNRREVFELTGHAVAVADTVGAGDAFTAALLTQHLEGKPLTEAARFANAYAAVVASKPGGTPRIDRAEVERLL